MRLLLPIAIATLFAANSAFAATCAEQSDAKKLAGAAKTSFMKKCETDAKGGPKSDAKADTKAAAKAHAHPSCADQAAEKKLAGAAKASFTKKCEEDSKASTKK